VRSVHYYNDIKELIGGTPLLKLNHMDFPQSVHVFAKLELFNPGGSLKDRMGAAMLEDAEKRGKLKPGGTIIEVTAGNAGIGIALAALNKGYNIIFVVPGKFSIEKQRIMRAYGATIINTPAEEGMQGAFTKAEELLAQIPDAINLGQFTNPANPRIHYETTGPEIYRDLDGQVDYIVAGAGSGGTISGILRFLKEKNPAIKGILADPVGSTMGGGAEGCYKIEGIGNSFMPETMDMSLIDDVIKVDDMGAFAEVRLLAAREGILAGSSSGAALQAARILANCGTEGNIVVILPDRGDRYFSKELF
jgi:cysteine synthase